MPTVNQSRVVSHTPKEMYALVNNINQYHTFLSSLKDSFEEKRTDESVVGTLVLNTPGKKHAFSTINQLSPNESISMTLLKGPFKSLTGKWSFTALDDKSTLVSLNLHFEFNNKVLALALSPIFNHLINSLTNAFCDEAIKRYGAARHD